MKHLNTNPSNEELRALWMVCQKYIADQDIICNEGVWQMDNVSLSALNLVDSVCEIVGYVPYNDDEF